MVSFDFGILRRSAWSGPVFIQMTGASFGLQAGGEATDLVLVATGHDGFQRLLKDKVKLEEMQRSQPGRLGVILRPLLPNWRMPPSFPILVAEAYSQVLTSQAMWSTRIRMIPTATMGRISLTRPFLREACRCPHRQDIL